MPVWIILIITAWFKAPKAERLPKVIFLMMTFDLNCRSRAIISWRSRGLTRMVDLLERPDHPAVRYILCKNPDLEKEEKEQRQALLSLTTKNLSQLAARKKKAADKKLSAAAGAILAKYRVGKYF
jgi:hypothetical protein